MHQHKFLHKWTANHSQFLSSEDSKPHMLICITIEKKHENPRDPITWVWNRNFPMRFEGDLYIHPQSSTDNPVSDRIAKDWWFTQWFFMADLDSWIPIGKCEGCNPQKTHFFFKRKFTTAQTLKKKWWKHHRARPQALGFAPFWNTIQVTKLNKTKSSTYKYIPLDPKTNHEKWRFSAP